MRIFLFSGFAAARLGKEQYLYCITRHPISGSSFGAPLVVHFNCSLYVLNSQGHILFPYSAHIWNCVIAKWMLVEQHLTHCFGPFLVKRFSVFLSLTSELLLATYDSNNSDTHFQITGVVIIL